MKSNKTEKKTKQNRDSETPQWRKEIGLRISKAREECSLSQSELADRLGVNRVTLTYWENGTRDIKTTDIVRLADVLGVSCDYLLRGVSSDNLSINAELGLSEKAISSLRILNEHKCALQALDENPFGYERVFDKTFEIDAINILLEHSGDSFLTHILSDLRDLDIPRKSVLPDEVFKLFVSNTELRQKISTHNVLSELDYFIYSKEQLLKKLQKIIEAIYIHPKLKEIAKESNIDKNTQTSLLSLCQEYEIVLSEKWDVASATQSLLHTKKVWEDLEAKLTEEYYADNNETE